jgi:hypothetical protein
MASGSESLRLGENNGMLEYWVHSCSIWLKNNIIMGSDPNSQKSPVPPGDFFPTLSVSVRVGRWLNQTVKLPAPHFNC